MNENEQEREERERERERLRVGILQRKARSGVGGGDGERLTQYITDRKRRERRGKRKILQVVYMIGPIHI